MADLHYDVIRVTGLKAELTGTKLKNKMFGFSTDTGELVAKSGGVYYFFKNFDDLETLLAGKEDSLGFTPEDVANKKTELTDNNDISYPSVKAVNDGLALKLDASSAYVHPTGFGNQPATALTGADVISQVSVNAEGHVTGVTSRNLTPANIGAEPTLTKGNLTASGVISVSGSRQVIGGAAAITHADSETVRHVTDAEKLTWTGKQDNIQTGTATHYYAGDKTFKQVLWAHLGNVPTTFAPSSHNHDSLYVRSTGGEFTGAVLNTVQSVGAYRLLRNTIPYLIGVSANDNMVISRSTSSWGVSGVGGIEIDPNNNVFVHQNLSVSNDLTVGGADIANGQRVIGDGGGSAPENRVEIDPANVKNIDVNPSSSATQHYKLLDGVNGQDLYIYNNKSSDQQAVIFREDETTLVTIQYRDIALLRFWDGEWRVI